MPKLYFAYGSNMNPIQMRLRCPNSEAIASATLKGYISNFKFTLYLPTWFDGAIGIQAVIIGKLFVDK